MIGQNLVKNAKNQKFKCNILSDFQTMCCGITAFMNSCKNGHDDVVQNCILPGFGFQKLHFLMIFKHTEELPKEH